MRRTNPLKYQSLSLTKRLLPSTLHALLLISLLPIALLGLYFYPLSLTPSPPTELPHLSSITYHSPSSPPDLNSITYHSPSSPPDLNSITYHSPSSPPDLNSITYHSPSPPPTSYSGATELPHLSSITYHSPSPTPTSYSGATELPHLSSITYHSPSSPPDLNSITYHSPSPTPTSYSGATELPHLSSITYHSPSPPPTSYSGATELPHLSSITYHSPSPPPTSYSGATELPHLSSITYHSPSSPPDLNSITYHSPSPTPTSYSGATELPHLSSITYHSPSPPPTSYSGATELPHLSSITYHSPSPTPTSYSGATELPHLSSITYHSPSSPIDLNSITYHSPSPTPTSYSGATELPHLSSITYHSPSPPPTSYSGATELPHLSSITYHYPSPPPTSYSEKDKAYEKPCDYFNGKWVGDRKGPLYNGTSSRTIELHYSCISNGRPDLGYLYWRWKPKKCHLPRFEPNTFLQLSKNRHIAFVGDSIARNQIESLISMLATASTPNHVYNNGSHWWHFPSHNATISLYWSPFLVQGVQRSNPGPKYNTMHLDHVDERWARDMDHMDLIVLAFGQWFSVPSIFYEGDSVIGCLNCPGLNYTDIGFYGPLRKALRITLNSIIERKAAKGNPIDVIVRTVSPNHFEGSWDKGGTCSKTEPYKKGEKKLGEVDAKIRRTEIEEMEHAKAKAKKFGGFRLEALDVTKLALMRPDGHPGAYINPSPFAKGVPKLVHNDCVHWCLPGPIDTWNEIFLQMMRKWEEQPRSKQ